MNSARPCCHLLWLVPIVQGESRGLSYRGKTMREVLHISMCAPDLMKSHWMLICHESCALTVCFNNRILPAPALPATLVEWSGNGEIICDGKAAHMLTFLLAQYTCQMNVQLLFALNLFNCAKEKLSFFQSMWQY